MTLPTAPASAAGSAAGGTPGASDLAELAVEVAERAAGVLDDGAGPVRDGRAGVVAKSSATDLVTDVDRASEQLIVSALLAVRPDDGVVAEEGSARDGSSGVRWIIDPLDGTTNYLYGFGSWAVSIAAEVGGEVVAGAVVDVARGETFRAARGAGARRDGEAISSSTATDLSRALVATGFSYSADRRRAQAEVLVGVLPRVRDIRREGAASVDLCSVACGRVDAYYERGLHPWDEAAGALIAREAGAVVERSATGDGETFAVLAAGAGVADALRDTLRAAGA